MVKMIYCLSSVCKVNVRFGDLTSSILPNIYFSNGGESIQTFLSDTYSLMIFISQEMPVTWKSNAHHQTSLRYLKVFMCNVINNH